MVQTGFLVQGPCDHDLERVNRLLVSSLQSERDTMRSFLDAWTAMEILINKTFKLYEGRYKYPSSISSACLRPVFVLRTQM